MFLATAVPRLITRKWVLLCTAIAAAGALAVSGCSPRGCSRLAAELSVPHEAGQLTRIDLISPTSMSGTGAPSAARREADDDIYEFSTLAFNHEEKRTLTAGLASGVTLAFDLPAGAQTPSSFSAWTAPSYVTDAGESGDANWQIMHDRARARQVAVPRVRARFRFEAHDCH
jgi:hypothetical protein